MNFAKYLNEMPVIPDVAGKILQMAQLGQEMSFNELEQTIRLDPGLTTKVLRVANSALYSRQNTISNLKNAITLMGFQNIRNLVLLVTASNMFSKDSGTNFYKYFWQHSLICAFFSKKLAVEAGDEDLEEEAFLAALLHNIGQVALYLHKPDRYLHIMEKEKESGEGLLQLEREEFDTDHREVGDQILSSWHFPQMFTDCARLHGQKDFKSEHNQLIILVTVADFMVSNQDQFLDNPKPTSDITGILPYVGMVQQELSEFFQRFMEELPEDQMYQECKELFELS